MLDPQASNHSYVKPEQGYSGSAEAPVESASFIIVPFSVGRDTTYQLFTRINAIGGADYSFWIKMDEGEVEKYAQLNTIDWEWKPFGRYDLAAGEHTLSIAISEGEAGIDKLCISPDTIAPNGWGMPADSYCWPDTISATIIGFDDAHAIFPGYSLEQNFPNPFSGKTLIPFEIASTSVVSIKVYSLFGEEIAELAARSYAAGKHRVEFDAGQLPAGFYLYLLSADQYAAVRKMIIKKE